MHTSVLLPEVLEMLQVREDGTYVDVTAGGGGHAGEVLKKLGPAGRLIVADYDPRAVERVREKFKGDDRVFCVHARFSEILEILRREGWAPVHGLVADLGISSFQLEDSESGIAFQQDAPLDMRLDPRLDETAADLLSELDEKSLADLLFYYGGERKSRQLARAIVADRGKAPFKTTSDLKGLAERVLGRFYRTSRIHPATRTFQALRIKVNRELEELEALLKGIPEILAPGGRAAVISFHSLEDGAVKRAFLELARGDFIRVTKKPIVPSEEEVGRNPRSRSAKLRVVEKIGG